MWDGGGGGGGFFFYWRSVEVDCQFNMVAPL